MLTAGVISVQVQSLLGAAAVASDTNFAPAQGDANFRLAALGVVALPLLSAALCGLCAAAKVKNKLPAAITVLSLGASFLLTLFLFSATRDHALRATIFEWIPLAHDVSGNLSTANFGFYLDSLSVLWMLFVTGLGTLIALYASEYMSHDVGPGYCRFFAAFSLFVFAMACLVMADNLVLLYLGWEGVGLCSYLLIGYFFKKPSAVAAAKKAFIMNRIGDLGLALGIMLCLVQFGTVQYHSVADASGAIVHTGLLDHASHYIAMAKAGHWDEVPVLVQLIPVLLMIGAFGKSAQFPLYVWLPDAMEGPTPVSALIHAATMVTAGIFLIARTYPLFVCSEWALPTVAWIGTITAVLSATIGMAQFDIKRIMAYSTCSQLGYMFAGLGVLSSAGAVSHVFTHAFFKAALFLCCGAVMHGFAGQLDLRKLSGVGFMKGWGIVAIAMLIGCLNLAGFPFSAGFFSKDMILAEAFVTPGYAAIGVLLLITAGMTAYYTFRVFFRVFVGPRHYEPGDELHAHDDHGHDHGHADHVQDSHGDESHAQAGDKHAGHAHDFHPHAPGWAINTVLAILAVLSLVATPLMLIKSEYHGWPGSMVHDSSAHFESPYAHHEPAPGPDGTGQNDAGHNEPGHEDGAQAADTLTAHAEPGTFFGQDPHKVMYYVSSVVGLLGIGVAFVLHYQGRTTAATANADKYVAALGPIAAWARRKWYVDEFYDFLIVKPLWVISHIFHYIDQLLVDGLVNLFGALPKWGGMSIRHTQGGVLHGYALGMAIGFVALLTVVLVLAN